MSVHVEWAYIFTAHVQSSQDVTPTNKLIIAASFPAQIGVLWRSHPQLMLYVPTSLYYMDMYWVYKCIIMLPEVIIIDIPCMQHNTVNVYKNYMHVV